MNLKIKGLCFLLMIFASSHAVADSDPLFKSKDILNAVLTAPLSQVYAQRNRKQRLWMPSQFAYTDHNGQTQRLDVSIRTRGVFRREECKLPPLAFNFKKKKVVETLLDGQDKLKLVSPCKNDTKSQQQLILEYLAYRSFEVITDHSLKTRLIRLSYVDTDKKRRPWTHLAFLIEDEKNLAKRLDLEVLHTKRIHSSHLDQEKTALVEMFEFMIANNDYSLIRGPADKDCCHNIELFKTQMGSSGIVPVPYDFDVSGLVDANYALPPEKLPIKKVTTRYFRGRCKSPEIMDKTIEHFRSKQEEVLSLFRDSNSLQQKYKNKAINYLQKFFAILDNPARINKEIIGRCRD